jgi:hypothetical protein
MTQKKILPSTAKQNFIEELYKLCVKHKVLIENAKLEFGTDPKFPVTLDFMEGRYPIRDDLNAVEAVEEVTTVRNSYKVRGTKPDSEKVKVVKKPLPFKPSPVQTAVLLALRYNPHSTVAEMHNNINVKHTFYYLNDIYNAIPILKEARLIKCDLSDAALEQINFTSDIYHIQLKLWLNNGGKGRAPKYNRPPKITYSLVGK